MSSNRCLAGPDPALQSLGSTWDLHDALLEAAIATATEQEGRGTGRFQTLNNPTACREVPRIPASTCSKSQNVFWKDGDVLNYLRGWIRFTPGTDSRAAGCCEERSGQPQAGHSQCQPAPAAPPQGPAAVLGAPQGKRISKGAT